MSKFEKNFSNILMNTNFTSPSFQVTFMRGRLNLLHAGGAAGLLAAC